MITLLIDLAFNTQSALTRRSGGKRRCGEARDEWRRDPVAIGGPVLLKYALERALGPRPAGPISRSPSTPRVSFCHIRGAVLLRKSAFTLLELIVVIAITAILLVALLPGIATLRGRSQSTSCQSNLHALATAFVQYSLEYPDRFPFGFVFNRQNANGRPASGENPINYITWFSSLDKYLTPGTNALIPLNFNTGIIDGATTRKFNLVFKCPSVPVNFQQQVHYYQHGVVMPVMPLELGLTPSGRVKITGPAKVNQVYPNTALVWDTPLYAYAAPQAPSMYWISQHSVAGYNLPCTFIDDNAPAFSTENGLLCHPEFPERRFRGPGADRFATSSNALKIPPAPSPGRATRLSNPLASRA